MPFFVYLVENKSGQEVTFELNHAKAYLFGGTVKLNDPRDDATAFLARDMDDLVLANELFEEVGRSSLQVSTNAKDPWPIPPVMARKMFWSTHVPRGLLTAEPFKADKLADYLKRHRDQAKASRYEVLSVRGLCSNGHAPKRNGPAFHLGDRSAFLWRGQLTVPARERVLLAADESVDPRWLIMPRTGQPNAAIAITRLFADPPLPDPSTFDWAVVPFSLGADEITDDTRLFEYKSRLLQDISLLAAELGDLARRKGERVSHSTPPPPFASSGSAPRAHGRGPGASARAPRGLALCIGLDALDPGRYTRNGRPWEGTTESAERDARAMARLAEEQGFDATLLLGDGATRADVLARVRADVASLDDGDFYLLTFSGHGVRVNRAAGARWDPDGKDEAWCLFDRHLIDDDLYDALAGARPGLRIWVLSDSCYSGTMLDRRAGAPAALALGTAPPAADLAASEPPVVELRSEPAEATKHERVRPFLFGLSASPRRALFARAPAEAAGGAGATPDPAGVIRAPTFYFGASQDDQTTKDGPPGGYSLFTRCLLHTWRAWKAQPKLTGYKDFAQAVANHVSAVPGNAQAPNFYWLDEANVFADQRPFTI
ncbi:MAG TPA: caspase family protein [Polyangiaceae bacterium]|nr:caspase family protein [Polyangiaceae bacterium]